MEDLLQASPISVDKVECRLNSCLHKAKTNLGNHLDLLQWEAHLLKAFLNQLVCSHLLQQGRLRLISHARSKKSTDVSLTSNARSKNREQTRRSYSMLRLIRETTQKM